MFPPIPEWEGLHPLIIHFPIGLLLIAPLFMVLGLVSARTERVFSIVSLVLVAIGTAAAYLSVETGEAAAELAIRTGGVAGVLEQHEELAETTSLFFLVLTVVLAVIAIGPVLLKKPLPHKVAVAVQICFLAAYLVGTVFLVNAAHQGGRLVHEFGVHAFVATGEPLVQSTRTGEHLRELELPVFEVECGLSAVRLRACPIDASPQGGLDKHKGFGVPM